MSNGKPKKRFRLIIDHPRISFIPRNAKTVIAYLDDEVAGYAQLAGIFLAQFGISITLEESEK